MTTQSPTVAAELAAHFGAVIPEGHSQSDSKTVPVDGLSAVLTRYTRTDGMNTALGGEHYSTLVAEGGRLLGLTRMTAAFARDDLPSEDQAREIALSFLKENAPDLLQNHRVLWIAPHHETITLGGQKTLLTGMKVKMQNLTDGRWFWVIVGADDAVMVFERDIVWVTMPGHRQTEKWLHDDWLAAHGGFRRSAQSKVLQ